jgi:hypothetical protein
MPGRGADCYPPNAAHQERLHRKPQPEQKLPPSCGSPSARVLQHLDVGRENSRKERNQSPSRRSPRPLNEQPAAPNSSHTPLTKTSVRGAGRPCGTIFACRG